MKINIFCKVIIIILILFFAMNYIYVVFAENYQDPNQFNGYEDWKKVDIDGKDAESRSINILGVLLKILRIITLGWAIIMLLAIAMKYMYAGPQLRAQLKTDVPTYVIGAVLLFGASGIMTLLQYFVEDNTKVEP